MSVLDSFFEEHRTILGVASAFEAYLRRLPLEAPRARHDLLRFVTFFREYGDLLHHEKEETLLLPMLARLGCNWEGDEFSQLRQEHKQERYLMRVLRQAAAQRGVWAGEELRHLKSVGQELVDFLRAHVERENLLIYPVARKLLTEQHEQALAQDIANFVGWREDLGYDGWLEQMATDLQAEYCPRAVA